MYSNISNEHWLHLLNSMLCTVWPGGGASHLSSEHVSACMYSLYFYLGAKIIIACRDMDKARAAVDEIIDRTGNDNVLSMRLDLADTKSIREFADAVKTGEQRATLETLFIPHTHPIKWSCDLLMQWILNSTSSSTTPASWRVPTERRQTALRGTSASITWVNIKHVMYAVVCHMTGGQKLLSSSPYFILAVPHLLHSC